MIHLHQLLHDERVKKKLSIEQVSEATKIRPSFIQAIERGEYHKLPASAYAEGFVMNYITFLGLPKRESLALFHREYAAEKPVEVLPRSMTPKKKSAIPRIYLQQAVVVTILIVLLVGGFLLYQYRAAFISPALNVYEPKDNQTVSTDMTVSGSADQNAVVLVDNEEVAVTDDGHFIKRLSLFPGQAVVTVVAKNKFGKETTVQRRVIVR